MSTEQAKGTAAEKKENVAEVTEKLGNLAVDNNNKANEAEAPRRGDRPVRGRGGGRGRGGRRTYQPRPPYDEQVKQIEEDLKTKKVLETGVKGYVKWFSVRGRYGFVAREKNEKDQKAEGDEKAEDTEDFFVHQTAILKSSTIKYYLRTLDDEEPVVFDIVEGRKGPEAANVTGPDGENVRGSRFSRSLLSRFGPGARRGPPKGDRKPREAREGDNSEEGKPQENGDDGEVRANKRRPRRARGKLQPTAENGDAAAVAENQDKEKGDGDASAAVAGEKKGRRRNQRKGKKDGEAPQDSEKPAEQQAATAQA